MKGVFQWFNFLANFFFLHSLDFFFFWFDSCFVYFEDCPVEAFEEFLNLRLCLFGSSLSLPLL